MKRARRADTPRRASFFALLGCFLFLASHAATAQPDEEGLVVTPQGRKPASPGRDKAAAPAAHGPKLVVLLIADQLRADALWRYRGLLSANGLLRLSRGATLTGHYGQQNTYTGPGHALFATGSYGYLNGITQNKWYNVAAGRSEAMMFDPGFHLLGDKAGGTDDETSPRNLVGSTVFDELRMGSPESKVVAVALKGRGALLLGGHLGTAYFFSEQSGGMTSSDYYMQALPPWVRKWNERKLADAAFGKKWERLLPVAAYQGPDDSPYEGSPKGLGRVFPHPLTGKLAAPGPDYYDALTQSPIGIDLELDFALAALEEEKLGRRGATDVLAVSFSGTDLVGHAYGPFSHEYQDMLARLDRAVARLLGELDRRFAANDYLVAFTADHGAAPVPEELARQKVLAARIKKASIKAAVNRALSERFGAGEWVVALEDPSIYLDAALTRKYKADPQLVEEEAGRAALTLPGMLAYYTRTQLQRGQLPPTEAARAVLRSYFLSRGGDVVLLNAPFYFWGKYGEKDEGTTHGSPYRYDTDVPVMLLGAPFVAGEHGVAEMVDVVATLSYALQLTPPAGCEGRPLLRMLRAR